jgi:hypothetical protein
LPLALTLSFTNLIIASTLVLSALFLAILFLSVNEKRPFNWLTFYFSKKRTVDLLSALSLASSIALVLLSFYPRADLWFVLRIAALALLTVYGLCRPKSPVILICLALIVFASSIAPMASLGFSAGETDQIAHALSSGTIISSGHISRAQVLATGEDPYYAIFPVQDYLLSASTILTGLGIFGSFFVLQLVLPLLALVCIVAVTYALTRTYLASIVSVLIMLATVRLAIWTLIPQDLSMGLALVALVPIVWLVVNPGRAAVLLAFIFVVFSNVVHASFGGLFLAFIPLCALALSYWKIGSRSLMNVLAITTIVGIVSYWTIWNITSSFNSRFSFVVSSFVNAFTGSVSFGLPTKQSLLALGTPYAFLSWAVPPSLVFSFLVYKLIKNRFNIRDRVDALLLSGSAVGLVLLGIGLYTSYSFGSLGIERYSDVPAFTVFMIVGSTCSYLMLRYTRRSIGVLLISILLLSLWLGGTQLNWAPDQVQSTYGYTTGAEFITTHSIATYLPANITGYFAQTLGYTEYWNLTKFSTFSQPYGLGQPIDSNRSATPQFLISYASSSGHSTLYYLVGTTLITNNSQLESSSHMDFVLTNGQYEAIVAYP